MNKFEIVILFGGSSDERRVSVASAQNVIQFLPRALAWFLTPEGQIIQCSKQELTDHARVFETDFSVAGEPLYANLAEVVKDSKNKSRLFFLALHGGEGEDGTYQKQFEENEIPFTGSGSAASAAAFDKSAAKKIAQSKGIRICEQAIVSGKNPDTAGKTMREFLGAHRDLIVKPVAGGSSIGLYRVRDAREADIALEGLKQLRDIDYLIEPFVVGREITVGVFQDGTQVIALPPSEVRMVDGKNFDYEGKYLGKGSQEITPAEIGADETAECQQLAVTMHRALGCVGYSRTDLILGEMGPTYLETNTLPGLTRASFIPQQLAAANLPFQNFLRAQLTLAEERGGQNGRPASQRQMA